MVYTPVSEPTENVFHVTGIAVVVPSALTAVTLDGSVGVAPCGERR